MATKKSATKRTTTRRAPASAPPADDLDFDEVDVHVADDGMAVVLPASLRRAAPPLRAAAVELAESVRLIQQIEDAQQDIVDRLRRQGLGWPTIGVLLRMTGEGARYRFGGSRAGQ